MRISDWSSDVCSSDLDADTLLLAPGQLMRVAPGETARQTDQIHQPFDALAERRAVQAALHHKRLGNCIENRVSAVEGRMRVLEDDLHFTTQRTQPGPIESRDIFAVDNDAGSAEHTSKLKPLMRL